MSPGGKLVIRVSPIFVRKYTLRNTLCLDQVSIENILPIQNYVLPTNRAGNVYVRHSKRFGRFDDFFIAEHKWETQREDFFKRAGLPLKAKDVPGYLTKRLSQAYDQFLELLPQNSYARVNDEGWQLSVDPSERLNTDDKQKLDVLCAWLSDNLRTIKLPELLIEVDNELHFTKPFMPAVQQEQREADQICTLLWVLVRSKRKYTLSAANRRMDQPWIKHVFSIQNQVAPTYRANML
jgi:hypothetical protein